MKTTPHNHGPNFGNRVAGCPRCTELDNGAEPVRWRPSRRQQDAQRSAEITAHLASATHRNGGCGPVCTFGDW